MAVSKRGVTQIQNPHRAGKSRELKSRQLFGEFCESVGLDARDGVRIMRRAQQINVEGAQVVSTALRIAAFMLAGCTLDQAAEMAREPGIIILDEANDHELATGEGVED